jgi:DNA end-binding protein Ku
MARPLWTGSINFGLVNIPVRMHTAQHEHEVSFHQLSKRTGNRVRYRKVDEGTGRELDNDDIVKGYEVANGEWVTFTDDELEDLRPESTRTLEIEEFTDLSEIDPIYYDRTYFLVPEDNAGAKRAYHLLLTAMQERGLAGIGRVVIRNKQYLAAVRPFDGVLALSTLRFADEVAHPRDIDDVDVGRGKVDAKSKKLATALIDSLAGPFDPKKYHDTYTEELRGLIEQKAAGETIEPSAPREEKRAEVTDLMAALEASLASKGQKRSTATRSRGRAAQRSARQGGQKARGRARKKAA